MGTPHRTLFVSFSADATVSLILIRAGQPGTRCIRVDSRSNDRHRSPESRMAPQQETPNPPSDRPSFFGLPAGWRVWSQVGTNFWAGVLVGVGIGLLLGAALVEQELMTLQRKAWVSLTGIVLVGIGQIIAWRVVRRSQQLEKDKPQNA
jgi:hypothetical protein